ncbi:hypothetical protein FEE95_07740 [Maribacter algarum]|uniref:Uncharacterized protein n=1 Tax=Maribacter algarum (ex Zhang et al. 2020) TaxID=2578118 RepID=A0A5S3QN35_9FLAO|nr:DUF308 domain-containing protein [Maribacter algarum]TMM59314.1 hypothetical protein FEE95_07740 [Maribacter algarum]
MTLDERLVFCKICANRKIDFKTGLVCSLTNQKPEFENECEYFVIDEKEAERKLNLSLDAAGPSRSQKGSLKPSKNINYGAFLAVAGIIVLLFLSILFGAMILITGISFLIRGYSQKKILAENVSFKERLKKN